MEDRPRLPPEILEQIVWELHQSCSLGDTIAQRTLSSLSLVSKVFRHWALSAKYSVIVAPRHVRDFRKWHSKVSYEIVGYNRALFVALDDVSKLTSTSAGWEADLQRLLQRLGPNVTHLSLWGPETRAVLRDPAQIRGPRFRNRMPNQTMEEVIFSTIKRRQKLERRLRKMRLGDWSDPGLKPLKIEKDRDEQRTKAEIAAARERARQKIPNWLKRELETKKEEDVKRMYNAHIGTTVREYQHELDVQMEVEQEGAAKDKRRQSVNNGHQRVISSPASSCVSSDEEDMAQKSSSSDSDDDYDLDWGCMPIKLSICPALPLHEHENALNFARMTIWTRVQELDVFIAVPGEVPRYLELFSSLIACPIVKFRLSSIYASLLVVIESESNGQPCVNLSRGLEQVTKSKVLSSLLTHEFSDKHMEDVSVLEAAIASAIVSASASNQARPFDDMLRAGDTHKALEQSKVRIKILQGNQAHWGKLKDRKQDFLNRSLDLADDCWDANMERKDDTVTRWAM